MDCFNLIFKEEVTRAFLYSFLSQYSQLRSLLYFKFRRCQEYHNKRLTRILLYFLNNPLHPMIFKQIVLCFINLILHHTKSLHIRLSYYLI